jgi:hypothetical protein
VLQVLTRDDDFCSDVSLGDSIDCRRMLPLGQPTQGMAAQKISIPSASVRDCASQTGFVLPLKDVASGHLLTIRVLQGIDKGGDADSQLRCLGQATMTVPGENSSLVGMTRLEMMDGCAHVGFCLVSLAVKRSPTTRVSKTRFAETHLHSATAGGGRASMSKTSASSSMSKTSGAASSPLASPAASKQSDFDDTSDWLTSRIGISARERRHDGDLDVDLNTSDRDTSDRDPNCNPSTTATFHSLYSLSPSHSSASPGGILKNCAPLSSPSHAASSSKGVGTVTRALQIECVRTYNNPHDGYTVYVFKCVRALYGQTWEIRRRFRDFQLLQTRLGKVVDAHTELLLPPKR